MTREENELLTRTGPGTPCGELMRRYWQPAVLSEELSPGSAPLPIKLLGEDLVLFRDDQGRAGLLGIRCSHRGADLSYGRIEDGGLRCIYHGWLYDIQGHCLDQPGEPGGGAGRDGVRHPAYPCIEQAGVIFTYLGPQPAPLFPRYEFLAVPEEQVFATKLFHECNYLQANEGNIDLSHLTFLHYNYRNRGIGGLEVQGTEATGLNARGAAPAVETADAELTGFGVRSFKIRRDTGVDSYHLYITDFVIPNLTAFPGSGYELGGYSVNWHVPIDDTSHWKYTFIFSREGSLDKQSLTRSRAEVNDDYKPLRNKSNRYLQDRKSMKDKSYTGLGSNFQVQDLCAVEGMGPIQDRTLEHLVSMDKALLVARKLLLRAIEDATQGRDPPNVVRDPKQNRFSIVATHEVVPLSRHWKEHAKVLEREANR